MNSQNNKKDSLLNLLNKFENEKNNQAYSLSDTNKASVLNELSKIYFKAGGYDSALKYAYESKITSEKLLEICGSSNYQIRKDLSTSYRLIALYYHNTGEYARALEEYLKSQKIREEIGDKNGIAENYNNMGALYKNMNDLKKALETHFKSLEIRKEIEQEHRHDFVNKKGLAFSYNNIGLIYSDLNQLDKALEYLNISLKIKKEINDDFGTSSTLTNIGNVYFKQNNYETAMEYFKQSSEICLKHKDKRGLASVYINIAGVYQKTLLKNKENNKSETYKRIEDFIYKALNLSKEMGDKDLIQACYNELYELYVSQNNYKSALQYFMFSEIYKDSLLNEENTKKAVRAEMNYAFDKKQQAEKLEQEKKNLLIQQESEKQKIIRNSFIVGFGLMLAIAFFIFKGYLQKQKANIIISKQKMIVEEKNNEITDSINYALQIQESILPDIKIILGALPETFLLFKPKDIVSGDFYWFHSCAKEEHIIAVGDCTGHGVPGAFLTMIGNTLLNEIVIHKKNFDPDKIIKELAIGVASSFKNKKNNSFTGDGMDISICKINTSNKSLFYAGVNQPIYLVNEDGINELLPQIKSINGIFGISVNQDIKNIEINLNNNDMLYMSTDGYFDQKGELTKKKFLKTQFKSLIKEIYNLPIEKQKYILDNSFNDWKGKIQQIDDVLIVGIKV